jgi:signal peptidase I
MIYQPSDPARSRTEQLASLFKDWGKTLLIMALFALFMNLFFPRYAVKGASMEPTLHETERLFVSNVDIMTRAPERGEVVILTSPHDGQAIVKRVIGLPGETVTVRGGVVYIDGVPLHEDYINEAPRYEGVWEVRQNQYFVLGDNRNHSLDSHSYGAVDASIIHGVVKFRWWPLSQLRAFDLPDYDLLPTPTP